LKPGVPAGAFDLPFSCVVNNGLGFVCPQGPVLDMPMYRFHPASDYSLANHNTADLAGDTAYLCLTASSSSKDSIASIFTVSVNTTWGRYALCNAGII